MDTFANKYKVVGSTHHLLLGLWGSRWRNVELIMFTVFIDDSGTDPKQSVAIATALIIPGAQIIRLETEWNRLRSKEGFDCFHTSEFYFRNPKSEFANWNDDKRARVFGRVRQITKKYGIRAISIAVKKSDYDDVAPAELRNFLGKDHYSWAVRQLIANLTALHPPKDSAGREWIFQWLERHTPARKQIEDIMDQMQFVSEREGIVGYYSDPIFKKSVGIPGLQCVDAVAWISYQYAVHLYQKLPLRELVPQSWKEFEGHLGADGWLRAFTLRKENLEKGIKNSIANGQAMQFFNEWQQHKKAKKK